MRFRLRACGGTLSEARREALRKGGTTMDVLVPVLVQLVAGGAGGNVLGQLARRLSLGSVGNSIVGAIGGLAGTWLAGLVPGLDTLVGTSNGLDPGALAGQGAVSLTA